MKIYMLWDMEGASGIVRREQTWHWEDRSSEADYEEGRSLLEEDINSAVQAALDAGADDVIIADTHSGGGNIRLDNMKKDPRVTHNERAAVRDGDLRLWMSGLETCDGIFLMGHHAKAGTEGAFLPHTWSGDWADVRLNGLSVGELGLESCFAAEWDVAFMLAQGDDFTEREVRATYPDTLFARTKNAVDNDRCADHDPAAARRVTAERIAEAVAAGPDAFRPFKPDLPLTVSITYHSLEGVERAAERPGATRVDDRTVEATVERHADVLKWLLDVGRR